MSKSQFFFLIVFLFSAFAHGQNIEIDTLLNSGIKDNRINFAFANVDHATANSYESKMEFISDLEDVLVRFDPNSPLSKSGFSHYRNFFNLYSVWFNDPYVFEPISSYYIQSQGTIDSLFLPWADDQHGWVTMMYSLKGGGGGGAGRRDDLRRGDALIWGLEWETILHEFNHTMPGVGDEYTASGEWSNFVCNESPNQSPALVKEDVPWRNWIDDDTPIPTPYAEEYFGKVGAFEGTISGFFGCQRPTAQSCYMGAGGFGEGFGTDMCPVCLQRFICRTYQFVDAIEDKIPASKIIELEQDPTITFSVNTVKPIPNTQKYKWFLNGQCIAENVETIDITFGECEFFEVRFEMIDTTDFVRFDEKFAYLYPEPKQSYTWYIYGLVADYDLEATVTTINADCAGGNSGKVIVDAKGGIAPYTYLLDGKEYTNEIDGLSAGTYQLYVVDAHGCDFDLEFEIGQDPIFDYTLVSEFKEGVWKLYPVFDGEDETENYEYIWSTGSTNLEIYTTEKGMYSLEVRIGDDCVVSKKININQTPCANLTVDHTANHPTENEDGAIYLDIKYGVDPYTIQWYKNEAVDLTMDNPAAVFSNGEHSIHPAYFLFDDRVDNSVDFWASGFTGENYVGYDFGELTFIDYYSLTSNVDVKGRDAKDWLIQGSNDMSNWDNIDVQSNIDFENRLEKKEFFFSQGVEYRYYRIFITQNKGDGWVAIQEMEFGATSNTIEIKPSRNQPFLVDQVPGTYKYIVSDQNGNQVSNAVKLINQPLVIANPFEVVQDGPETVKIEDPVFMLNYYWFADPKATELLATGLTFQPPASGNYYVRAVFESNQSFATGIKGFAVTMQQAPEVENDNGTFSIVNPNPDAEYNWYDSQAGGQPIHTGTSFTTQEMGTYYVNMNLMITYDTPIEPHEIGNITLWADASDIDGDNEPDQGLENSSAYKWKFRVNGQWNQNGWHAYRTNYSNGLGVVDLATVWFQYVENEEANLKSFIITYEENGFSREGSAPFYGLKQFMARQEGQDGLFSANISDNAKNSLVYLNGKEVDPSTTYNSYEMKSLSMVLDQDESLSLYAIDEYWEGKIAEFIVFDKVLNEEELKGIHAYMRKKWLSTADLASPRTEVRWVDEDISFESAEEVVICYGHDYLGLTEEGTYIREMKTSEGHDSTVTTTLIFAEPSITLEIKLEGGYLSSWVPAEEYQWYFNGIAIEGANTSEYAPSEEGDYSLVVTLFDGCMVESNVFTYIISDVSEKEMDQFNIYPNPTSDFLTIENLNTEKLSYTLSNSNGQILRQGQIGSNILIIDISLFDSGIYTVILKDSKSSFAEKIIKY